MKKKKPSQKKEIIYNLVNASLAGILVLLGSFSAGSITKETIFFSVIASGIVAISQFKNYWDGEKQEYCTKIFNFTPSI